MTTARELLQQRGVGTICNKAAEDIARWVMDVGICDADLTDKNEKMILNWILADAQDHVDPDHRSDLLTEESLGLLCMAALGTEH